MCKRDENDKFAHAELKIIQNAGHEVNIDAPEKLGEVLKAFLIGLLEL